MVARIATLSKNRGPHVNPLCFVYENGRIYLGMADSTLNKITTIRTDRDPCRWYVRQDVRKYFMSWSGLVNTLRHVRLSPLVRGYLSSGERGRQCVLEVVPESAALLDLPAPIGR